MKLLNLLLIMISNIFLIFKAILFWLNLFISVILIGPIAFLFGLFSYKACLSISKLWCKYNLFFLKRVCSLSYDYSGPKLDSYKIVISNHQSVLGNYLFSSICSQSNFYIEKRTINDSNIWMVPVFIK